ncbi:NAD-dependent protein deacetylase sirtuin-1 [Varanus komodoensis]|nr:NAD-dependent protein deacetylase sirtuin-1 [Varanus komodoensis]
MCDTHATLKTSLFFMGLFICNSPANIPVSFVAEPFSSSTSVYLIISPFRALLYGFSPSTPPPQAKVTTAESALKRNCRMEPKLSALVTDLENYQKDNIFFNDEIIANGFHSCESDEDDRASHASSSDWTPRPRIGQGGLPHKASQADDRLPSWKATSHEAAVVHHSLPQCHVTQCYKVSGENGEQIAKTLKLSCSTVAKTIQRFNRTGSTQNRPRHGRPKKLGAHAQRHIQRLALGNRRMSAASIAAEVEGAVGQPVSAQPIRCTLHQIGLQGCHPRRKPLLKMMHKKARKQFAEDKQTKDMD